MKKNRKRLMAAFMVHSYEYPKQTRLLKKEYQLIWVCSLLVRLLMLTANAVAITCNGRGVRHT